MSKPTFKKGDVLICKVESYGPFDKDEKYITVEDSYFKYDEELVRVVDINGNSVGVSGGWYVTRFKKVEQEMSFKKGDRLRCIDDTDVNLTKGKIYHATSDVYTMDSDVELINVNDDNCQLDKGFYVKRFEKALPHHMSATHEFILKQAYQDLINSNRWANDKYYDLAAKYMYKAESLIETVEINVCGSSGGFFPGQTVMERRTLMDRYLFLMKLHDYKVEETNV